MRIEHIAMWTNQLEQMREFYVRFFHAKAGSKYQNTAKHFESYFISFSSGARLELMSGPDLCEAKNETGEPRVGYTHVSYACGSEAGVDELIERMRKDGYRVEDGPRHTGDGYYEGVVLDPDGNRIEITV
jgi:lactoylglutathione lyase